MNKYLTVSFCVTAFFAVVISVISQGVAEIIYRLCILAIFEYIALTDIKYRKITNAAILTSFAVTIVFRLLNSSEAVTGISYAAGLIACFVLFVLAGAFTGEIGSGDMKLAAFLGYMLGIWNALKSFFLAGILIFVFILIRNHGDIRRGLKEQIPLGPFMTFCAMIILIF